MREISDAQWRSLLRRRLLAWYAKHRRDLPWRRTTDAYAIWVSEIMLQQTQVATVIDYYKRFLSRFPNVNALAAADEQQVLALWSGLGYYRRARQMHAAAQVIADQHAGQFPEAFDEVLALPGVGRYTAGAITSLAYGQRQPILEANTIRLFSRLMALRQSTQTAQSQQALWRFAEDVLPQGNRGASQRIGELNQALMELGSLVCLPKTPKCDTCPLAELCPTFEQGLQHEIPVANAKKKFIDQRHALVIIARKGRLLMRCNPTGNWWAGLWDLPRVELPVRASWSGGVEAPTIAPAKRARVEEQMLTQLGLDCSVTRWVKSIRHGVTRYKIQLFCFEASVASSFRLSALEGQWKWVVPEHQVASDDLPLTSTASRVLKEWIATVPARGPA